MQCEVYSSIVYRDDACDAKKGSQVAMDLVLNEKVHAIIGTVCSEGNME